MSAEGIPRQRLFVAARYLLGLTQEELADRSGVPIAVLERLEAGKSAPRATTLMKLESWFSRRGVHFTVREEGFLATIEYRKPRGGAL